MRRGQGANSQSTPWTPRGKRPGGTATLQTLEGARAVGGAAPCRPLVPSSPPPGRRGPRWPPVRDSARPFCHLVIESLVVESFNSWTGGSACSRRRPRRRPKRFGGRRTPRSATASPGWLPARAGSGGLAGGSDGARHRSKFLSVRAAIRSRYQLFSRKTPIAIAQ